MEWIIRMQKRKQQQLNEMWVENEKFSRDLLEKIQDLKSILEQR